MDRDELKGMMVSGGTMRTVDLISAFLGVLREYHPWVEELQEEANGLEVIKDQFGCRYADEEKAALILEDLLDALNEIAPDGCYFGPHPGDGACYGFWEIEESDEED